MAFSVFTFFAANAQNKEMKNIEKAIIGFAQAADNSDADKLATYLDDNYRIVMNRMFGSAEIATMNKVDYLENIKTKVFGGDKKNRHH